MQAKQKITILCNYILLISESDYKDTIVEDNCESSQFVTRLKVAVISF